MTTDMQARDEQEFEAWLKSLPVEEIERSKRDKNMPKIIWKAALAAERARSAVLVEGIEIKLAAIRYHNTQSVFIDQKLNEIQTALKTYRGESILGGICTINPDVNFEEQL